MRWNTIFYSFSIGGFCTQFAANMPYPVDAIIIINAMFKAAFTGVGLASIVVGFCAIFDSFFTHEKEVSP